jgi:hypothetical protein
MIQSSLGQWWESSGMYSSRTNIVVGGAASATPLLLVPLESCGFNFWRIHLVYRNPTTAISDAPAGGSRRTNMGT